MTREQIDAALAAVRALPASMRNRALDERMAKSGETVARIKADLVVKAAAGDHRALTLLRELYPEEFERLVVQRVDAERSTVGEGDSDE